mmetsp:Transcript_6781/g.11145  ORF Transcript_6781/g.11145 Transcript_6781/m.11145 type:complete len:136 (-) Transcript_6781:42-449(-)
MKIVNEQKEDVIYEDMYVEMKVTNQTTKDSVTATATPMAGHIVTEQQEDAVYEDMYGEEAEETDETTKGSTTAQPETEDGVLLRQGTNVADSGMVIVTRDEVEKTYDENEENASTRNKAPTDVADAKLIIATKQQ